MKYISVAETAKKWNISERSVRNYCAQGRVPDAFLTGKTWMGGTDFAPQPCLIPQTRKLLRHPVHRSI